MNLEMKVLSELIGDIYDTALDATLWPGVLKNLAEFVGGSAAAIYCKSPVTAAGAVYHQFGFDPHYQQLYLSKYIRFDPSRAAHCLADIGQLVSMGDIMSYRELQESRFHQEWATPQGVADCLTTPLDKSANGAALFGVFRHEDHGIVDDEVRRRGGLIAPHVRRAALIGNVLDTRTAETTAFMEALNGLAAGVFLVDGNGRVVFANLSGREMLEDGRILRLRNDTLATADARPVLADVIAAAGDGDAGIGVSGIAVPLTAPPEALWLAHVLPLTSGARRETGTSFAAVAAVFVHQSSLAVPSAIESISKLYRLTPGELRVLAAVSEVGGISAVADVIGISEATVKTHLQRVFAKTGTDRQTELIKLVVAHASPLRRS
jgi:DNA-binding CsgD family transcriptional regulator